MNECLICKRIEDIKDNKNPHFVKELETSYVVIGDHQFYRGYTLVLSKLHVDELHKLPKQARRKFLNEMSIVAESVFNAFKPNKLNYELLGNTDRHLHWHIIPRYENDPNPKAPIWVVDKAVRYSEDTKPSKEELKEIKNKLGKELDRLISSLPEA